MPSSLPKNGGHTHENHNYHSLLVPVLAHLSGRLVGELIGYPWSGVRPSSSVVHNAQRSSPKLLGQSKLNFTLSLLGKGEQIFVPGIWVT